MSEIIYLKDILLAKAAAKEEKKAKKTALPKVKTRYFRIKSSLVERVKKEDAR